jgi:hypothetical protein
LARRCTVCTHPDVERINAALVAGELSYRAIAKRFGISKQAVGRHAQNHLPATLARAQDAEEVAEADDLLGQIEDLREQAQEIKDKALRANDLKTALQGIRELVRIIELLAKLRGELDERPQVNILLLPQWVTVRSVLLDALMPFPDARAAAAQALLEVDGGTGA